MNGELESKQELFWIRCKDATEHGRQYRDEDDGIVSSKSIVRTYVTIWRRRQPATAWFFEGEESKKVSPTMCYLDFIDGFHIDGRMAESYALKGENGEWKVIAENNLAMHLDGTFSPLNGDYQILKK